MMLTAPMQIANNNKEWTPIDFNLVFLKVNTILTKWLENTKYHPWFQLFQKILWHCLLSYELFIIEAIDFRPKKSPNLLVSKINQH